MEAAIWAADRICAVSLRFAPFILPRIEAKLDGKWDWSMTCYFIHPWHRYHSVTSYKIEIGQAISSYASRYEHDAKGKSCAE